MSDNKKESIINRLAKQLGLNEFIRPEINGLGKISQFEIGLGDKVKVNSIHDNTAKVGQIGTVVSKDGHMVKVKHDGDEFTQGPQHHYTKLFGESKFVPESDVNKIREKNPDKTVHDVGTMVTHKPTSLGGEGPKGKQVGKVVKVEDHGAGMIAHYVMWPKKRKPEMHWGSWLKPVEGGHGNDKKEHQQNESINEEMNHGDKVKLNSPGHKYHGRTGTVQKPTADSKWIGSGEKVQVPHDHEMVRFDNGTRRRPAWPTDVITPKHTLVKESVLDERMTPLTKYHVHLTHTDNWKGDIHHHVVAHDEADAEKKARALSPDHNEYDVHRVMKEATAVMRKGGSVGDIKADKKGHLLVSKHEDHEEAKAKAKRLNKGLSSGEKKYYGISYFTKKLKESVNPKEKYEHHKKAALFHYTALSDPKLSKSEVSAHRAQLDYHAAQAKKYEHNTTKESIDEAKAIPFHPIGAKVKVNDPAHWAHGKVGTVTDRFGHGHHTIDLGAGHGEKAYGGGHVTIRGDKLTVLHEEKTEILSLPPSKNKNTNPNRAYDTSSALLDDCAAEDVKEETLDEAKWVIRVNSKGQRKRKLRCNKGQVSKKINGRAQCRPQSGQAKMRKRLAIRKAVRTKKSRGAGLRRRTNMKRARAMKRRAAMGLGPKKHH